MVNRIEQALERSFFKVEKRETYDDKGNRIHAIVDATYGKVIAKVSDRYTLLENQRLVQPFIDKFGLPDKVVEYANRKAYLYEFLTGREFDFGGGDIIKEKLVVANSYDKTKSFSFFFGAFRMVCSNGLYTAVGLAIAFKKIHVGEIPVETLTSEALGNYQKNNFDFWKQLKQTPLEVEEELAIIDKWIPFNVEKDAIVSPYDWNSPTAKNSRIKKYAAQQIAGEPTVNNSRDGWGLFNGMNRAIRAEYYTTAQIAKRIQGDKRSEKYLAKLLEV